MSLRDIQTTAFACAFGGAGVQGDSEEKQCTRGSLLLLLTLAALLLEFGSVFRTAGGLRGLDGSLGLDHRRRRGSSGSGSGASGIWERYTLS